MSTLIKFIRRGTTNFRMDRERIDICNEYMRMDLARIFDINAYFA